MHPALRTYYYDRGSSGVEGITPTQQAHSLVVSDKTETTEILVWARGSGSGILVVGRSGGAVNSDPVDGTPYTANSVFGSGTQIGTGNYVLYNGTGTTVNITGLTAGTVYHYEVYEYDGTGSGIKYRRLGEKGRAWTTLSNIPHEVVDAVVDPDSAVIICGSTKISYSTDQGSNWTQWADLSGEAFHSMFIATGGTIHNASGNPVTIKYFFNSHSGTAKVYASYSRGGATETAFTGAGSQTWNTGAWNPNTSRACLGADSGSNRIAILDNGRTVSYQNTLDAEAIASICSTPGASDNTEFLACFKNASESGKALAKRVSGSWTKKNSPVGKVFHMIKWIESLGIAGASSADGTGNDFIYSDDLFETYDSADVTGAFGDWCWDDSYGIAFMVSRTPGEDYQISFDLETWYPVTNPDGSAVWFNVESVGDIFMSFATSGTNKGAKTTPSNITNAQTRFPDYTQWIADIQAAGFALGTESQNTWVRNLSYAIQDGGYRSKIKNIKVYGYGSNIDALTFNLRDSSTHRAIKINTPTFLDGSGVRSAGTSCLRSGFTPSTHASGVHNYGVTVKCGAGDANSKVLFGSNGADTSTRNSLNPRDASGNMATVAMNATAVAGPANPTSAAGVYTEQRSGATAVDGKTWKSTAVGNAAVLDASSNTVGSGLSPAERYDCGLNNNGSLSLADDVRYISVIIDHDLLTDAEVLHLHNALWAPLP
jgi:hypothetical protein